MKIEGSTFLQTLLRTHYGSEEKQPLRRAILETTYFIDPAVVAQTKNLPIIRARRTNDGERKNTVVGGEFVSDNFPPDYVFRAATSDTRDKGSTQLCHIYGGKGEARDTFLYTNLANLCLMPAFLAKFADTDPAIVELLKECAYVLYSFDPLGTRAQRQMPPPLIRRETKRRGSRTGSDDESIRAMRTLLRLTPDQKAKDAIQAEIDKRLEELKPKTTNTEALRGMIRTAAPPKGTLFESLTQKTDARFLDARSAGFLFASNGTINEANPWVADMISRRDHRHQFAAKPKAPVLAEA